MPGRAVAAGDEAFLAVPKHLQVFRTPPAAWPEVVALCKRLGIAKVAIAIGPDDRRSLLADPGAARGAFRPLGESGLGVRCLIGEGAWVRGKPGTLPGNLDQLLRLNDALFRFEGLLLDVEPQVLPEWKAGDRAPLVHGMLALLDTVRAACRVRGLKLSAALAPWYTKTPDPDRPGMSLFDACLQRLDEALVMAYRNQPDAVVGFAGDALAALASHPIPCWIGLTTQHNNAASSTYYGLGLERLQADVAALYERLRAMPMGASIAGIALHQFSTLRDLAAAL